MILWMLGLALAADVAPDLDGPVFDADLPAVQQRAVDEAIQVELSLAAADQARGEASAWTGRALPALAVFSQVGMGAGFTPFGFERPIPWQAGFGVRGSWTVVDPSGWAAATAARRTARGRDALVAWSRAQARRDAAVRYAEAWSADRAATQLDRAATDARTAEEAIAGLVDAGLRPAVDRARARSDALDLEAQAAAARGDAQAACARLQGLVGAQVTGRCVLSEPPTDLPRAGPDRHPALIAAEEAVDAARSSADQARYSYLPSLSADGTAAQYIVPDRGNGLGWSANFTLEVPLTIGTTGPGELAGARAEQRRARGELVSQERELASAAVGAQASLRATQQALAARRGGLAAAEEAWERTNDRYEQGLDDITAWLTARRAFIQAGVALAYARAAVVAAIAEVEGVRGVQ